MERVRKIIISLIVLAIIAPFTLAIVVTLANNYVAMKVEQEIKSVSLPQKTELVESISSARKLIGNGNGMQYFGAVLIKSELSLEELDIYYSQYREKEWEYVVEVQQGSDIAATNRNLKFKSDINSDKYYIIYSWGDTDYDFIKTFDIRGR